MSSTMREVGNRDLDNYTDQWRHGELCGKMDRISSELRHLTTHAKIGLDNEY